MRYLVKRIPSTSLVQYDGSRYYCEIAGGTAEKATVDTTGLLAGSKYLDVQTGTWYVYDELTNAWAVSAEGGSADPAVVEAAVEAWLDAHPEATTTVQDGSISYAKLDSALKGKADAVTQLSDEIESINNTGGMYLTDYQQGTFNANGQIDASNYFITSAQHVYDFPIIFSPAENYRYNVWRLIDGTWTQTNLMTTKMYCINANTPFRVVVGYNGSQTITPKTGYNKLTLTGYTGLGVWHNANNIDYLQSGKCLLPFVFINGSDAQGTFVEYVNYRVTNKELISFTVDTNIFIKSGYKIALHSFKADGAFDADLGWKLGSFKAIANTKYRFVIAKETEDTSSIANLMEFYTAVSMETDQTRAINALSGTNPLKLGFMMNGRAKLVAHTGYKSNDAPENTIPAFINAGKNGFWGIESDLQQTSDGYFVMCHDTTVDRTTDGTGTISAMTLAQIRELHISGTSLQIPTFEEYLSICKMYGCVPVVELKSTVTNTAENYTRIIAIVENYGLSNQCIFIGSKWAVTAFKNASAEIPYMPVYQNGYDYNFDNEIAMLKQYTSVGISWDNLNGITGAMVSTAHALGMLFGTFTVDSLADVKNAFLAGVDFVTTNSVLPTD